VHRDIKPGNTLLFKVRGRKFAVAKISDFGNAKAIGGQAAVGTTSVNYGALTRDYSPPEVLDNAGDPKNPVHRAPARDVWGLALLLSEIVLNKTYGKVLEERLGGKTWIRTQGLGTQLDAVPVLVAAVGEAATAMQLKRPIGAIVDHALQTAAEKRRVPDVPAATPGVETVRRSFAFDPAERPTATELELALAAATASGDIYYHGTSLVGGCAAATDRTGRLIVFTASKDETL